MCKRIFKGQTADEGEVPFYKIGTFGSEPDAFISRELFDEYKNKYPYPNKGDILISASGSIGRTVEFTGKDEYFQDSNIVWLKHGKEIDNNFLKVLYSVVEWSCEGSTIKRLYNDNFLKTEFMLPGIDEQIKLGTYFSKLDNLITLHQSKLKSLGFIYKIFLGNSVSSVRLLRLKQDHLAACFTPMIMSAMEFRLLQLSILRLESYHGAKMDCRKFLMLTINGSLHILWTTVTLCFLVLVQLI